MMRMCSGELDIPGAGPEPGPHVASVWWIKVAIGASDQLRAGGPAAAPEDLVPGEPGLRVFLVWACRKPGESMEVAVRPFPGVSNQLVAAKGVITGRQCVYGQGAHCEPIEIR